MKDDAPAPDQIPVKRRQLERAPDLWLAQWEARVGLTPSERRRVREERARRKALSPDPVTLLTVRAQEGMTPAQVTTLKERRALLRPDSHRMLVAIASTRTLTDDEKFLVKDATTVIACPRQHARPDDDAGVWKLIKYARHRGLPVQVVLPDGTITNGV